MYNTYMNEYLSQKIKIVSFFAICCVLVQHAINFTGYIDPSSTFYGKQTFNAVMQYAIGYGVARPAVALFFLLSGYLFFRNYSLQKTLSKFRSRLRSLLIPYFLWGGIGVVFILLLQWLPFAPGYFSSLYTGVLSGKTIIEYIRIVLHHGVSFQLWFLVDLLLYTLLAPIFYIVLKYSSLLFLVPLYVLWILQVPLPPVFSFVYRGGLFYLLGAYIGMYGVYIPKKKATSVAFVSLLCWFAILAMKTAMAFGVLPTGFVSIAQLDNIAILMGVSTIWFGYDKIVSVAFTRFCLALTPFTFFVYASHEPLLEGVKKIGIDVFGKSDTSMLVVYALTILVTFGMTLGVGYLLKKTSPKVFSVLTGGRS